MAEETTLTPGGPGGGFVTESEADDYFADRMHASKYWTAETNKTAALLTAENDLIQTDEFTVDLANVPDDVRIGSVCEQALFLLQGGAGIDLRMGLLAQGVSESGIVQERYDSSKAHVSHGGRFPIAPRARAWLKGYITETYAAGHMVDLSRDA